jgi:hypothetical protein
MQMPKTTQRPPRKDAKLTEHDREEILRLRAEGKSAKRIKEELGLHVSEPRIYQICDAAKSRSSINNERRLAEACCKLAVLAGVVEANRSVEDWLAWARRAP